MFAAATMERLPVIAPPVTIAALGWVVMLIAAETAVIVMVQTELVTKSDEIQNRILIYLGKKKASELTTANLERLQNDLKQLIQADVLSSGIAIYKVLFRELQTF